MYYSRNHGVVVVVKVDNLWHQAYNKSFFAVLCYISLVFVGEELIFEGLLVNLSKKIELYANINQ